jgi:hypothetical protein
MFNRDAITYGLITTVAIFFVGWSTGMGGSFWPNVMFSIIMGLFAFVVFGLVKKIGKPKE